MLSTRAEIHAIPVPPVSLINFLPRVHSLVSFGSSARGRRSRARKRPNGPPPLLSPIEGKCNLRPAALRHIEPAPPPLSAQHCRKRSRCRRRVAFETRAFQCCPLFPQQWIESHRRGRESRPTSTLHLERTALRAYKPNHGCLLISTKKKASSSETKLFL